jgi:hypothetical protein
MFRMAQTTLDSCINLALRNHPSVQGANYAVQQQQQLKKTNFILDPLNVNYEGGQLNSEMNDYHLAATTGIAFDDDHRPGEIPAAENIVVTAGVKSFESRTNQKCFNCIL